MSEIKFIEEVEAFAGSTMDQLPATAQHLQEIIEAQRNDEVCMQVRGYCQTGWPAYMSHQPLLRPYWESRAHLAVVDDLLLYDERIVIPQVLRLDVLDCIHRGHRQMPCESSNVSLVAWAICSHRRHGQSLFHMCKGAAGTQGAPYAVIFSEPPLGED